MNANNRKLIIEIQNYICNLDERLFILKKAGKQNSDEYKDVMRSIEKNISKIKSLKAN